MKKQRAPYARRSVWYAIGILSVVLVAALVIGGYEINHLRTQTNGLQTQITELQAQTSKLLQEILQLGQSGK
jgi:high-affinity nickel permease